MRAYLVVLLSIASLLPAQPVPAQTAKPAQPKPAAPAPERPLPTLNIVVPERDRAAVYAFYRGEIAAGRCPAPLVRKDKSCVAPTRGKQAWKLDQPLPDGVKTEPPPAALIAKLSPSPAGCQYVRVDTDILLVGIGTRVVTAFVADLSRL